MGKPTPGPWKVNRYLVNRDGLEVGSTSRGNLRERLRVEAADDLGAGPIIADMVAGGPADARLIAAAPDGLEAAKVVLVAMREMHTAAQAGRPVVLDRGAYDALEAFVKKAVGE